MNSYNNYNFSDLDKKVCSELSQWALKAVSKGLVQLGQFKGEKPSFVAKETIRDIVTPYDRAVQSVIIETLQDSKLPCVGEEGFEIRDYKEVNEQRHWSIDPIDGTVNFCKGIPFFGVSVGLVKPPKFELGALGFPELGEIYFSDGRQAFLNGKRLRIGPSPLSESLTTICLSSSVPKELREDVSDMFNMLNLETQGSLRLGSTAVALGFLASSKLQAVVGVRCKIWDVSAGLAIAEAAGAKVQLRFHEDNTQVSFLAAAPIVFENLHRVINPRILNDIGVQDV
jgi:myo-inositol-1(or 4)-monophosphatase